MSKNQIGAIISPKTNPFYRMDKKGKKQKGKREEVNPGGFTEPNFGKVKQKSNAARHGVHSSFTAAK